MGFAWRRRVGLAGLSIVAGLGGAQAAEIPGEEPPGFGIEAPLGDGPPLALDLSARGSFPDEADLELEWSSGWQIAPRLRVDLWGRVTRGEEPERAFGLLFEARFGG